MCLSRGIFMHLEIDIPEQDFQKTPPSPNEPKAASFRPGRVVQNPEKAVSTI